ncbi:ATP-binding protein [Candidatus Woesearchaeota archaeon]|nr:ATP-binding protein [Candidatus Woesearchaeota archaeon]
MTAQRSPNPFNPGSPVDPNDFVGRVSELENFKQKLMQTANGSLANMAVAGGYGVGKTSFLHKCKALAEESNALAIYFSLNEIDELSKERLAAFLIRRIKEKVREEMILERISNEIFKVIQRIKIKTEKIELSLDEEDENTFPNLQTALVAAWKTLKGTKKAIVFLLDEARVLERNRAELLLYLRAVLEHLQIEHIPVMILPAGKLTITGPTGTGFSPLVRTFQPALLENFSREEANAFITKKLNQAGVEIELIAFEKIYNATEGHPFVLTAYMNSAYSRLLPEEKKLTQAHFKATDVDFVKADLAPFFARFYDQTGRNSRKILSVMANFPREEISFSELAKKLAFEMNELSPHLGKLVQDGSIIRIDRGKYKLFHHLLGEYIKSRQQKNNSEA